MKKFFLKSFLILMSAATLFSCQSEEKKGQTDDQATPFEFTFDVGDIVPQTKNAGDLDDLCPGLDELEILANANHLLASITVVDKDSKETTYENIELNFVKIGDGKLVTDPILMNIPETGQYCFNVTQVTVYNNELGDMRPIFSSMHESSENQAWVDKECLLPSPDICLDQDDLYQKVEVNVCVFCTYDEDAEFFGYIKWNIQFKRFICLPFSVNICDLITNEDIVGVGTISIESGTMQADVFVPDGKQYDDLVFPAAPNKLADICFIDEMDVPNVDEWYRLTMQIGDRTFLAVTNVAELLTYADNPAVTGYDAANHYIHFWFCDGKAHWFFNEITDGFKCSDAMIFEMREDNAQIPTVFAYTQDGTNWTQGLPGDIQPTDDFVVIPTGTSIVTQDTYRFFDGTDPDNMITNVAVRVNTRQAQPIKITLYDRDTQEVIQTVAATTIDGETYSVNFDSFTNLVNGGCYFVMITSDASIEFERLSVQKF